MSGVSVASVGILFYRDNMMKYNHRNFFYVKVLVFQQEKTAF